MAGSRWTSFVADPDRRRILHEDGTMVVMGSPLQVHRAFTTDDLDGLPDDGNRYELVDGQLLVSPAPAWGHQDVVLAVAVALRGVCPQELRVVMSPFDVRPDQDSSVQPDLLVARYVDLAPDGRPGKRLTTAPLLAVEVLSPSSRLTDTTLKTAFYARLGVASYWIIDPDLNSPRLRAYELDGPAFREVADVRGGEAFHTERPFRVSLVPSELVRGLLP